MEPVDRGSADHTDQPPAEVESSLLNAAFAQTTDAVLVCDANGRPTHANAAAQRLLREASETRLEIVGVSPDVARAATGETMTDEHLPLALALRGQTLIAREATLVRAADGTARDLLVSATPVRDAAGEIAGAVATFVDITARRQAEAERERLLAAAESQRQLLQTVVDNSPAGIALLDGAELRVKWANSAYQRFTDEPFRSAGVIGLRITEFMPFADEIGLTDIMRQVIATRQAQAGPEYEIVGFARGVTYWSYSLVPVVAPDRDVADLLVQLVEVTEQVLARKRTEKFAAETASSLIQLEAVIDSIAEGLVIADLDGRVLKMNREALRLHGFASIEEARRTTAELQELFELHDTEGRLLPVESWPLSRILRGETQLDTETETRNLRTGRVEILSHSGTLVRNAAGQPFRAILTLRDVTERKEAEKELARLMSEVEHWAAELDAIVESMAEGLIVISPSDEVVRINRAALAMIGVRSAADVPTYHSICAGLNVRDRDGAPLPLEGRGMIRALRGEEFVEQEILITSRDGAKRRLFSTASPVRDQSGNVVLSVGVFRDVTRDREIEAERERLLKVERAAHDAAERHAAQMRALVTSLGEAVVVADASGQIVLRNEAARRITGRTTEHMQSILDGRDEPVFWSNDMLLRATEWPISRALRGERFVDQEIVVERPDRTRRRIAVSGSGVREDGRVTLGIVVFRDVTELRDLERMKDEYVSLISHDLRNPLTVLTGQVEMLRRLLERQSLPREADLAGKALASARRMNVMIQDLVETARLESGRLRMHLEPTDLAKLVSEIAERVGTLEDRGRLRVETPTALPTVSIDPNRLERALVNLITNALKYSPAVRPVTIQVSREDGDAVVAVTDQGPGIPPEDIPSLGQRFYQARTATRVGGGLGLGLYITRLLAEAHGGRVRIESELGRGSTFSLVLPIR